MNLRCDFLRGTGIPAFKVGLRRNETGHMTFVWVVDRHGSLKKAEYLCDGNSAAMVKLVPGDTVFHMSEELIILPHAINYFLQGQNVRRIIQNQIIGHDIQEWVQAEFIPVSIKRAIDARFKRENVSPKFFVAPSVVVDTSEKSKLVFSTDNTGPDETEATQIRHTRPATYGKKRRAL